jgi:hypothetical protein
LAGHHARLGDGACIDERSEKRDHGTELQPKLGRDPLLAPRAVGAGPISDQALEIDRNPRPTAASRLRAPEETIPVTVPANERVRAYDRQHLPAGDKSRQQHDRDPRRVVRALRPHRPLNVEGELLAQEQILSSELGTGAED